MTKRSGYHIHMAVLYSVVEKWIHKDIHYVPALEDLDSSWYCIECYPFYLGNEDHLEAAEHRSRHLQSNGLSVCWVYCKSTGRTVGQTEKQQKALLTLFLWLENGSNQMRGGVFVRSFPVLFFFSYLPTSTCFHVPLICYKVWKKSVSVQPVHSAGERREQNCCSKKGGQGKSWKKIQFMWWF